jgi:hypothetical protein
MDGLNSDVCVVGDDSKASATSHGLYFLPETLSPWGFKGREEQRKSLPMLISSPPPLLPSKTLY